MIEDRIQRQVLDMYREVDRAVTAAGPICVASGKCCRFKEYGHTLYLSNLEADVLLSHAPSYEQPVSADFCPFQKENLCTAREPRPLACQIFFCDPNYQETANRLTEEFLHRLKALALENDIEWRYAPLHQFLNHEAHTNPKRERGPVSDVQTSGLPRSRFGLV